MCVCVSYGAIPLVMPMVMPIHKNEYAERIAYTERRMYVFKEKIINASASHNSVQRATTKLRKFFVYSRHLKIESYVGNIHTQVSFLLTYLPACLYTLQVFTYTR